MRYVSNSTSHRSNASSAATSSRARAPVGAESTAGKARVIRSAANDVQCGSDVASAAAASAASTARSAAASAARDSLSATASSDCDAATDCAADDARLRDAPVADDVVVGAAAAAVAVAVAVAEVAAARSRAAQDACIARQLAADVSSSSMCTVCSGADAGCRSTPADATASAATCAAAAAAAVVVVIAALALASPRFLATHIGRSDPFLVRPRGLVLLLGALAFVAFLVEGAVLDWSALLLTRHHGVAAAYGGVGYVAFSLAMTTGRLTGDRIVAFLGRRRVMVMGGLLTTAGLLVTLIEGRPLLALGGFVLVGLGASNIVPVLFSEAGRQRVMPAGLAIAAMTTVGYAGILVGPAAIGFVAASSSLPAAHALLAALMLAVPLSARVVRAETREG